MEPDNTSIVAGALYVVATPIGNLSDVTLRAISVLRQAEVLLAEDTRRTHNLLSRLGIERRMLSCHEHNEKARTELVLGFLSQGKSVALVSDAGTPAISDPGFLMVAAATAAGHPVFAIPGPCAVSAAVSASGFSGDRFFFAGFPPRKQSEREALYREAGGVSSTLVFYESPNRAARLAAELAEALGDRRAVLFRELTKVFEEAVRGSLSQIAESLSAREAVKGECVLVVDAARPGDGPASEEDLVSAIQEGLAQGELAPSKLATSLAQRFGWPRKKVYELILHMQKSAVASPE
ncbi:MAG: 16S rRNA (cytidine(1402)-2'-O)-methyltransferase [Thermodesulfobacteriota bacterium]